MMDAMIALETSNTMSRAHQSALQLASIGFPVFPLWGVANGKCACGAESCTSPGKHPRWDASFKDATTNSATIDMWFKEANLNFGVRTGVPINGTDQMLAVIDVDSYKQGGDDDFDMLLTEYGKLPDTAEVQTGAGGRHLYFLVNATLAFDGKPCRNVDLKVNGYVVGPGSLHVSGKHYEWEASSDPCEGQQIAKLPYWFVGKFSKSMRNESTCTPVTERTLSRHEALEIRCALLYIPADDYQEWVRVLMALKSTGDEQQGFAIAEEWSRRSSKYTSEGMRKKWKEVDAEGGITLGTLFDMGRKAHEAELKTVDISRLLARFGASTTWAEPEALAPEIKSTAYPIDALPTIIANAVIEVQQFVQAPMAMVACSAMATVSVACQARNDIERARGLIGPTSLYFLTVAESGERKSTLDGHFSKPIHDYEKKQAADAEAKLSDYAADLAHWAATKKGLEQAATRKAESSDKVQTDAKDLRQRLRDHEQHKPAAPVIPRLIYRDATPEALLHGIAKEWPSVALMSSEGGIVFGGHGMSKDSLTRNLATINELWDGKPIRTDRRAVDASHNAEGRMTVAIQVQPVIFRAFVDSSDQQARGSGFLARFLVACPDSTQGKRLFIEAPEHWPMLEQYRARITELLNLPQQVEHGRVNPSLLYLSHEAKQVWIAFHDEIEVQLVNDGELHSVRDVASKIADNAARIAALFHVIAGETGSIEAHIMAKACRIARWHLNESRRLFNTPTTPTAGHAQVLDRWLVEKFKQKAVAKMSFTDILKHGPSRLRNKVLLESALAVLIDLKRAKLVEGVPRTVHINPVLIQENDLA